MHYNDNRIISIWHDRNISAGEEWKQAIDIHLNTAKIILLLISPDFIASDYCYSIEMEHAMKRHECNEARVIPVILRPVYWQKAPFSKLQVLPTDAVPVTSRNWHDLDEAFFCVAEGIRKVIQPEGAIKGSPISPPIWNVPYQKNPYFTGRKALLKRLHQTLASKQTDLVTRKQALSGLGGSGKTQIALEYAYQYYKDYRAIFWVRADSRETLLADFMNIAHLLNLPEREQPERPDTNLPSEEQSLGEPASGVGSMKIASPNTNWYQVLKLSNGGCMIIATGYSY